MMFALICTDKQDSLELRMRTRPAHLEYLRQNAADLVSAGPRLDPDGNPCGSVFILDMPERVAAETFAANDPYEIAGLFSHSELTGYRSVFKDGAEVV
jgi:uncharacterized protein YciI